jgi:hypothetical protein
VGVEARRHRLTQTLYASLFLEVIADVAEQWKVLTIQSALWAVLYYAIAGQFELNFGDTRYLDLARLISVATGVCLALLALLFTSIAVALRGSSRGPRILLESGILLLVGLPAASLQATADVDVYLDASEPVDLIARVTAKHEHHVYRQGTHHNLFVTWPPGVPAAMPPTLSVSVDTYDGVREGGAVDVTVRRGALGAA